MKYITVSIPEETAYIIPIGDVHVGDKAFNKEGREKLNGYLRWVKDNPNARIFLNGDIFNVAGRNTATSPFETDSNEYSEAVDIFRPYASQIIGATDGNHEQRMVDEFDMSPMQHLCRELRVPYCKFSAIVRLKVGKRKGAGAGNRYLQNYFMYFHHTTGGGGTVGSKLNRVAKLREIIEGIDVYCGSHNHQLAAAPLDVFYPSIQGGIKKRRMWFVDCGSYQAWNNSFAERSMMGPTKLGSPRIRFDSSGHDCHVSL